MGALDILAAINTVLDIVWKLATAIVGAKLYMDKRRRDAEQVSMTRALYIDTETNKP